jgi:drug/metabolite transporter (DMT)-like permease
MLALLGFVLYSLLTFAALMVLNPSDLGMTLALIPGFTYALGLAFFNDRVHHLKLLGVPLATGAALYYTTDGFLSLEAADTFGIAMAAGAAFGYALYGLTYKRFMADLPMTCVLPFITTVAFLMFLPWFLFISPEKISIDLWTVAKLLILGAGLSAPVFLMYHAVIDLGGVLYANSIGILSPFAILLTEWAFGYRNSASLGELIAMTACAVGVALIFKDASRSHGASKTISESRANSFKTESF